MAPVKRPRSSSKASSSASSKKRKLNSGSSSAADAKPFTPGQITSSKRHKKSSTTVSTIPSTAKSSTNRIRKPHKKPLKDRYTDAQLKLPTLNGIVPAGVAKPRGKKKGKVFVEDKDTMMGILELVNASVDGVIQGKVEKNRRLEIIREQKRLEQERKEREKEAKLEDAKDSLRKKRKRKTKTADNSNDTEDKRPVAPAGRKKKSVSFA
ncbi:60S ribosomal subunit assembly/export protein [Orbilia brochopaga]|uniref:60S ribosomal subunit assembly/export protein n=1 Tax=Orbilia brochopaga TaxID=3140254 RepID=A0AAV9UM96_9PEZI